ncbi:hypothetical protein BX666DRAFT_135982 [Dichotomocladium elegans]|nr:hypothetical protein BX666DRAFT_135982 [Dichotomocladium elegans]
MGSQQSRPSSTRTRKSSLRSSTGSIRSRRSFKLKQHQQQLLPPSLYEDAAATIASTHSKQLLQQTQQPSPKQKPPDQLDVPSPLGQHLQRQYQRPPRHRSRRSSPSRSDLSRTYSVLSSSSSSMSSMAWSGGLLSQLEATCSAITNTTDFSSRFSSAIQQPKEPWPELAISIPTTESDGERAILTASDILAQLESHPASDAFHIFKRAISPDNKTEFFQAASAWYTQHPECNIAGVSVARCLLYGWGVSANPAAGLSQLRELATTKGAWEAYIPLAEYYNDNHIHQDAIHWYTRATEADEMEIVGFAQFRLGEISAMSQEDQALEWFKKSAKSGNRYGQFMLGINYQYGIGGTKDLVLARKYLLASAEQELADAQCALGIFYYEEVEDPVEGRIWIDRAVEKNNGWALLFLGHLYETQGQYGRAIELYKTAATVADDAKAQYHVGLQYRRGTMGLPQDYKEAVRYLSRSAQHGYAPAQRMLGLMYAQGLVEDRKNDRMAFTLFRQAASQGDVHAMCMVGTSYEMNNQDDLALEQYRRAARIVSPFRAAAQLLTGLILLKMGRLRDAYTFFKDASAADVKNEADKLILHKSQLVLARYSLHGWAPVPYDPCAGFQALQALATSAGETRSTGEVFYWLGTCYEEGLEGVCEPELAKAFECHLKAAEAGHMDSAFKVALALATQRRDRAGAFPWYEKAAALGHPIAQYTAGFYHVKGIAGVPIDLKKARGHFESSAVQGYVPAMTSLAALCRKTVLHGSSVRKNQHKLCSQMVYWYKKAAAAGDAVAQRDLAMLYGSGLGVKQNYEAAFDLLTKASQQNDTRAILLLGSYYQNGIVAETNLEKAMALYDRAAKLGAPT